LCTKAIRIDTLSATVGCVFDKHVGHAFPVGHHKSIEDASKVDTVMFIHFDRNARVE
jgi:hypothetical protein